MNSLNLKIPGAVGLALVLGSAALLGFANPSLAANCRSNVECDPPVTVPDITGTPGENGWWRSDVTATLLCIDASGCSSMTYSLDQGDFVQWDGLPFGVAGDGLHSVEGASEDKHGNKEIYPTLTMVRIDTVAPSVAITSPTAGNAYVRNVEDPAEQALPMNVVVGDKTVEAAIADATSGAQRAEFFVDGVQRNVDGSAPFTWLWHAGDEHLGDHTVTVVGYDVAGNSASASITVTTVPTSIEGLWATANHLQELVGGVVESVIAGLPPLPEV